jgi:hypothetical protein
MAMVANNPKAAKRVGVSQSVGKDFLTADKGRKFNGGSDMADSKAMMKKEMAFMKKKGAPKSMAKHEMGEMGAMKGYAKGGKVGSASKRADGAATKGKTRGKLV